MENFICFLRDWGPFIISLGALGIAISIPWRIFKRHVIAQLLQEYRSTEMGIAIIRLWSFAQYCLENGIGVDEGYKRIYYSEERSLLNIYRGQNTLHMCRRKVSQFYQQLSTLNRGRLKRFFLKNFSTGDFRLIRIVYTIERYVMPDIVRPLKEDQINEIVPKKLERLLQEKIKKKETPVHNSHFRMLKLYLKSRKKKAKDKDIEFCEQQVDGLLRRYTEYKEPL